MLVQRERKSSLSASFFKKKGGCEAGALPSMHQCSLYWYSTEEVPAKVGGHANFSVYVCCQCNKATVYPEQNYLNATSEHKEKLKLKLLKEGLVLMELLRR